MTAEVAQQVLSCGELSAGDEVEAWHNGKLFHRGEVIRTVAATDLFWIQDRRTGTRRLIDAEALVIRRAAVPAAKPDPVPEEAPVTQEAPAAPAAPVTQVPAAPAAPVTQVPAGPAAPVTQVPAGPASHVPLFQAPSLAS